MPQKTAAQECFFLDIITIGSPDASNGIAKAPATNQYGNCYRWCKLLKRSGIADELLGGIPQEQMKIIVSSFTASVQRNQFSTTRKRILQKGDIRFYKKCRELSHDSGILHIAGKVSPTFCTQKNRVKNATVKQWQTAITLFPVRI